MADKPANDSLAKALEEKFGHLFEKTDSGRVQATSDQLSDVEKSLISGDCVHYDGDWICRRGGVWVVC